MFGIENIFTFVLNFFFFFCIWIGNESEDRVPLDLVRIHQSGQVQGDDRDLTLKWYHSYALGGYANDFLKWFKKKGLLNV